MKILKNLLFLSLIASLNIGIGVNSAEAAKASILRADQTIEENFSNESTYELEAAEGGMGALFKSSYTQKLITNEFGSFYSRLVMNIDDVNNYSRLRSTGTIELTAGLMYLGLDLDGSEGNKINSLVKDDVVLELVRADGGIVYQEPTLDGGKYGGEPNPYTGTVFQYYYKGNYEIDPQFIPSSGVTISLIDNNKCMVMHATGYDVSEYTCADALSAVGSENQSNGNIYGVADSSSYNNAYNKNTRVKSLVNSASTASEKKAVIEQFMPNRSNLAYQNNISSFSTTTNIIKGNRVNVFAKNDSDPYKYLVASNDLFGLINKSQTYGINEGVWGKIFYQDTTQDADSTTGTPKVDVDSTGLIFGIDETFANERWLIGASLGYIYSDASDIYRNTDIDSYFFNIYNSYMLSENLFFTNILEYSYNDYDNDRFMSAIGEVAKADYETHNYNILNELGYNINFNDDKFLLTPRASLNFYYIDQENYTERGSSMNQTVENNNIYQYETGLGIDIACINNLYSLDAILIPKISFDYKREMRRISNNQNVSFVSDGSTFIVYNSNQDRDRYNLGIALDYVKEDLFSLGVEYNREFKEDYRSNRYSLNGKYKF